MEHFGIPLKPSTILVFSIASDFVDDTIHFFGAIPARIRSANWKIKIGLRNHQRRSWRFNVLHILRFIRRLFGFSLSDFGGTIALGD
jgi:hypothetical protein